MANFAPSKKEKVQNWVKFICSILLFAFTVTTADKQELTELPQAMPQVSVSCYTDAGQSTAEHTLAYLYDTQLAVLVYATIELPGQHPTHGKHKCQQTMHRAIRNNTFLNSYTPHHHHTPIPHHVIDYYIYTLEHILI